MKITGSTISLTIPAISVLAGIVNACDYAGDFKEEYYRALDARNYQAKMIFYAALFLLAANVVLFFIRNQRDWSLLLLLAGTCAVSLLVSFMYLLGHPCGDGILPVTQGNFAVFLLFFVFQFCLWLNRSGFQPVSAALRRRQPTVIKLQ